MHVCVNITALLGLAGGCRMRALGVSWSLRWGVQLPLHSPSSLAHMQTVLLLVSQTAPVLLSFLVFGTKGYSICKCSNTSLNSMCCSVRNHKAQVMYEGMKDTNESMVCVSTYHRACSSSSYCTSCLVYCLLGIPPMLACPRQMLSKILCIASRDSLVGPILGWANVSKLWQPV